MGILTSTEINRAKTDKKELMLSDGAGLYLSVKKSGTKSWLFRYKYAGRRKWLSFAHYPITSLKQAREMILGFNKKLSDGFEPLQSNKELNTINDLANQWLEKKKKERLSYSHIKNTSRRIEVIKSKLGSHKITQVKAIHVIELLRRYEDESKISERDKIKIIIDGMFKYAIAMGQVDYNPCYGIGEALHKRKEIKHFDSIKDSKALGQLLRDIDDYNGSYSVSMALKLAPFLMLRPIELSGLEWSEIDFKQNVINIPANRMKRNRAHHVPLTNQAIVLLKEVQTYSGKTKYVFVNDKGTSHIHRDTLSKALRVSLKYNGIDKPKHVTHGFRGTASTILNSLASKHTWDKETIEKQLSHESDDKVRAAYNHAEYMDERLIMLQFWADYLDTLKNQSNVIHLPKKKAS